MNARDLANRLIALRQDITYGIRTRDCARPTTLEYHDELMTCSALDLQSRAALINTLVTEVASARNAQHEAQAERRERISP